MPRRTLKEVFIDELKLLSNGAGNFVGNITLKSSLGWNDERYDRIKNELLAENLIKVGRGYGGAVAINEKNNTPLSVFISYSHHDEKLKIALQKHLTPLKRLNIIDDWCDRKITAGQSWSNTISEHLESSDIILLLVSIDFINSEYCYEDEFKKALNLHRAGKTEVVPVILRACAWKHTLLSEFQVLPIDAKPVISWINYDEAFSNVAEGILKVAKKIQETRNG